MKLECVREKLNKAVSKAEKISGKNLSLPILSCILLEAQNNTLKIRSTNLDLGVEIEIPVKVTEKGVAAVSGSVLNNFLSNLKSDNVFLETEDGNLKVKSSNSESVIKSNLPDDFPTIPKVSDGESFTIKAKDFIRGLKSVWYGAAISSMKPELSSVYVHYSDDGEVIFVATDSFRLAEKKVKVKNLKDFGQILIPFKNISEIIKILEEVESEEISVNLNNNQISFSFKDTYLTSRIIDGVFPDYNQIIPKDFKTDVTVLKQDLIDSLKLANIFSDKFNQITMKIDPKTKTFEVKTKNSDIGENTNKIDSVIKGDEIEISFNYKYIVDCFQSIESDSVSLNFSGISKPMVVKGISENSFMYLVMPMNK